METKELSGKHKAAIKEALESVQKAMDGIGNHHKAHNAAHKAHMEALTTCHKTLSDAMETPKPEVEPETTDPEAEPTETDPKAEAKMISEIVNGAIERAIAGARS